MATTLLAIDPGEHSGYAWFEDGILVACGVRIGELEKFADKLVIEKPTIYQHSKARPNDIVTLAITAGRLAERAEAWSESWVLPRQWKGQIEKTKLLKDYIVYKWIKRILSAEELAVLEAALRENNVHDIVDAVGIGLHDLKRFPP